MESVHKTVQTPKQRQWRCSGVFTVNSETDFINSLGVSIVNFDQVNAGQYYPIFFPYIFVILSHYCNYCNAVISKVSTSLTYFMHRSLQMIELQACIAILEVNFCPKQLI